MSAVVNSSLHSVAAYAKSINFSRSISVNTLIFVFLKSMSFVLIIIIM